MLERVNSFNVKIEDEDCAAVSDALINGWGSSRDKHILEMEDKLQLVTDNKFAIAVSHGTDAIHLALAALDLKPGDEVIVPDLTWVACVAPVVHMGLIPVFINVDDSLCVNPNSFSKAITKKTKAIIAVDLAGSLPEWDKIIQIARLNDIYIIEDAAESLGGFYKNKPAGSFGDISILSFSGTKVVTGGHGGAVLTNSEFLYKKMKLLYHHGIDQNLSGKYYWSTVTGYNYQISNIQAALIVSQLNRLETLVAYKESLFNLYNKHLANFKNVSLVKPKYDNKNSYWLIVALINSSLNISKEELILIANKRGVDIRPFFYLLSEMPPFKKYRVELSENREETQQFSRFGICLPYGYDMDEIKVKKVVAVLKEILK
jgi:perosamine synthetase